MPTLAVLLTDIVDSTTINDREGDAVMAEVWRQHDESARHLIRRSRGREVARSDGFLALFEDSVDAVEFAIAYHSLTAHLPVPLKARIGIHCGPLTLRENNDQDWSAGAPRVEVDGIALPVAARVLTTARAGQTLMTADAVSQLKDRAGELHARSCGHWRLKGVDEPIELYEVGTLVSVADPPADTDKSYRVVRHNEVWLPRREIKHSLPAERDHFFGRASQLQDLFGRLGRGSRLVTVLGTGGTGKTRLVVRLGWSWLGEFPGGVWFCDLAQALSMEGIAVSVATGLRVPLGSADPVEQLGRAIIGRGPCLVILDNFEQVARHGAGTLGRWLDMAEGAKFVVTSREVLGIPGEQVFSLGPLTLPEGAALFCKRSEAAAHGWTMTQPDQECVAALVRLLDGLPLAIELAAARMSIMTPQTLLLRMSERFSLLSARGSRRDRQSTLRATFDWSWDLLSATEKEALARISVFVGPFSLAAAEAVVGDSSPDEIAALDLVQTLVDKSFLQRAGQRLTMLQTIQEYAAEHLATPGRFAGSGREEQDSAQKAHWTYYASLDERAAAADGAVELDNLVAACRRATKSHAVNSAVQNLVNAWAVLRMTGPFQVGSQLVAQLEAISGWGVAHRAKIDWVAGSSAHLMGRPEEASSRFKSGLLAAREAGLKALEIRLLCSLAEHSMSGSAFAQAENDVHLATQLADALGDPALKFLTINQLGAIAVAKADLRTAAKRYEEALSIVRHLGDRRWQGGLLSNLGAIHFMEGRFEVAALHYEQALELVSTVGDRRWEGSARCNLGLLYYEQRMFTESSRQLQLALTLARELGHLVVQGTVHCNLGLVAEALGDIDEALYQYEASVAVVKTIGAKRSEGQFRSQLGLFYAKLGRFDESETMLMAAEALLVQGADHLSMGMFLCSRAGAALLQGKRDVAENALARAHVIWVGDGSPSNSELGRVIARTKAALAG